MVFTYVCVHVCVQVSGEVSGYHDYLILSQLDSTMVLQTGQEITELDASGFATQCPTIFAGNMRGGAGGGACYIIQVTCKPCCPVYTGILIRFTIRIDLT